MTENVPRTRQKQFTTIIIALILGVVTTVLFPKPAYSAESYAPMSQAQTIYLPLIVNGIPEIDTFCRWPHVSGSYTYVSYKWGDRLQNPGSAYRNAFESSIADWNGTPTKILVTSSPTGNVTLNTYDMQDGRGGVTYPTCSNQLLTSAEVLANVYYDPGRTVNSQRALTGHELGHGLGLGHIPDSAGITLMGYNPNPNTYYVPQNVDVVLMNQVYP